MSYNCLTKIILYIDFWLGRKWVLLTPMLLECQLYILNRDRILFESYKIMCVYYIIHGDCILPVFALSLNIECLRYIYMDIYRLSLLIYTVVWYSNAWIYYLLSLHFSLSSVYKDFWYFYFFFFPLKTLLLCAFLNTSFAYVGVYLEYVYTHRFNC